MFRELVIDMQVGGGLILIGFLEASQVRFKHFPYTANFAGGLTFLPILGACHLLSLQGRLGNTGSQIGS